MAKHKVSQGEHLTSIIVGKGFADSAAVWGLAENQKLKDLRKNFNILNPDDEVFVPEKEEGKQNRPVDTTHKFVRKNTPLTLRLVIQNPHGKPVASTDAQLVIEGETRKEKTDGDGLVKTPIKPRDQAARVKIETADGQVELNLPVNIGHLNPVTEAEGQRARLNNLGYRAGEVGCEDPSVLRSAIEEFQCDNGLKVDGDCGPKTQDKLVEVHGC